MPGDDRGTGFAEWIAAIKPGQRIAGAGALSIPASMALPWYGVPVSGGLVQTGVASFGWIHAALVLTSLAVLYLVGRSAAGRSLPEPVSEGTLIAVAGVWCALLILVLITDRPEQLAGFSDVRLRYGIFVAMAGAGAMIGGGLTRRAILRTHGR